MPSEDPLYPYWEKMAAHLSWDPAQSVTAYHDVIARYDEPHRHFHTRQHLRNIFAVMALDTFTADDQAVLIAATFWHDAVYDASNPQAYAQNEERSAVLAAHDLRGLGADDRFIARTQEIIRNTKTHHCDAARDPVGAQFLDSDMATLSGSWENYRSGSRQLDAEFNAMPCEKYYTGRLTFFIDPLLAAPTIYLLPENEAKWGVTARANLTAEKALVEQALLTRSWESTPSVIPQALTFK